MACPKSSDLDIYVFFVDMGGSKGSFSPLSKFKSRYKMSQWFLGMPGRHKQVDEVISLLWRVNLYLLSQSCSFGADFCANRLIEL
jgi:hypothetical protein